MPRTGERTSVRRTRSSPASTTSRSPASSASCAFNSRWASARKVENACSIRLAASRSADLRPWHREPPLLQLALEVVDLPLQAQPVALGHTGAHALDQLQFLRREAVGALELAQLGLELGQLLLPLLLLPAQDLQLSVELRLA